MSFAIVWSTEAEMQLESAGQQHPELLRNIIEALNGFIADFQDSPELIGESRFGEYRVHTILPVTLYYRVDVAERKVTIVESVLVLPRPKSR